MMFPSINNDLLKRAIEAVSIRQVLAKFGRGADVPERDGVKFCSILRPDRNPSCSIADGRYHDWSQDRHLDSYSFFQELSGLDSKKAFVPFVELSPYAHELNGNGSHSFKDRPPSKLDWAALVNGFIGYKVSLAPVDTRRSFARKRFYLANPDRKGAARNIG
jgi:hypothetical protein